VESILEKTTTTAINSVNLRW